MSPMSKKIALFMTLLITLSLLSSCTPGTSSADSSAPAQSSSTPPAQSEPADSSIPPISPPNNSYMEQFNATAQSVLLNNTPIQQAEPFFTKTGVHSYSEAFGTMEDTLTYTTYHKDGTTKKTASLYLTSDLSAVSLPAHVKYTDTFSGTLDALNLTEKVKNRQDERFYTQKDGSREISVSFLSFHTRPVNTDFQKAYATVYLIDRTEKITQSIGLVFREGKLTNISYDVIEEYPDPDAEEINNNKVGIKFLNPQYRGEDIKIKLEEVFYQDGKINITYSVKTATSSEINVMYSGWQSADNGILYNPLTHNVTGEEKITDIIPEPFFEPKNLYKNYMHFIITLHNNNKFQFSFTNGDIEIYRNTSR